MKKKPFIKKKKKQKKIINNYKLCRIYIKINLNNTILTATTTDGKVIISKSAGCLGFKKRKRSAPYAALMLGYLISKELYQKNYTQCNIFLKGIGKSRLSAIKGISKSGLLIRTFYDITAIPHNGCRLKKKIRK
jgi:small subunit ribosomal protein S11